MLDPSDRDAYAYSATETGSSPTAGVKTFARRLAQGTIFWRGLAFLQEEVYYNKWSLVYFYALHKIIKVEIESLDLQISCSVIIVR